MMQKLDNGLQLQGADAGIARKRIISGTNIGGLRMLVLSVVMKTIQ